MPSAYDPPQSYAAQVTTPQPTTPQEAPKQATGGDCEQEIAKYNWDYNTAVSVAKAESGLRSDALNNNPATGDYSVGCFQINLFGGNAASRPSEQDLRNPAVNVEFAYKLYSSNGHSFLGQWGVCRNKVKCY